MPLNFLRHRRFWQNLLHRFEPLFHQLQPHPFLSPKKIARNSCFIWRTDEHGLQIVDHPEYVHFDDLLGMERAKALLLQNTRQFVQGLEANHALLWGSRGTGKSSLVKAIAVLFADQGLKLIEIPKDSLLQLPFILRHLKKLSFPFLLFCDDLSFDPDDARYKTVKNFLDGGVEACPRNIILYATSNRRHLMPREFVNASENFIHPEESADEEISLSDRFGLWIGFYPMSQELYLAIIFHMAISYHLMLDRDELQKKALDWARVRGARSGRVAKQFFIYLLGEMNHNHGLRGDGGNHFPH